MKAPSRTQSPPAGKERITRLAINAFLIFHLVAITVWAVPLNTQLVLVFRGFLRPYMLWSGLFQSWDTFAPLPRTVNARLEANVIGQDGTIQVWTFPRMEQLGLFERYGKERYRKFAEVLEDSKNVALMPDVARHLVRRYKNPANPPAIIVFVERWTDIKPDETPAAEQAKILYSYAVQPQDLE